MVLSSRTTFSEEPVQLFADLLVRTAEGMRVVDARRLVVDARAPVDRIGHCTHVRTEVQLVTEFLGTPYLPIGVCLRDCVAVHAVLRE
jgi:hypothetical protein